MATSMSEASAPDSKLLDHGSSALLGEQQERVIGQIPGDPSVDIQVINVGVALRRRARLPLRSRAWRASDGKIQENR